MERETENQSIWLEQQAGPREAGSDGPNGFALAIARATRTWIQYGVVGFAVACIVIAAAKGLMGF